MSENSNAIVFCESYGQYNYALAKIEELLKQNIHVKAVIVGFADLYTFFTEINSKVFNGILDVAYIPIYNTKRARVNRNLVKLAYSPLDVLAERQYLEDIYNRHFAMVRDTDIYYIGLGTSGTKFYLLSKLAENNRLTCLMTNTTWELVPYKPQNKRDFCNLMLLKLAYGSGLMLAKMQYASGFPYMKVIGNTEVATGTKLDKYKVFDVPHYDVIYLDTDLYGNGYIGDEEKLYSELSEILTLASIHRSLAIKYHPGQLYNDFNNYPQVPRYIPSELMNASTKVYLSAFSISLAHIKDKITISIIDLLTFKDKEVREQLKNWLIGVSNSAILFPQTLGELGEILEKSNG